MKQILLLSLLVLMTVTAYSQPKKGEMLDPSTVKMELLPINTIQSDFGPAVIGDSLFFTTYNESLLGKKEKQLRKREFYDLYNAPLDENGNVIGERHAIDEFLTKYHDGPVSWCEKTGELFLTQSNYVAPTAGFNPFREDYINLRIIAAKKVNGVWKQSEKFPYNNKDYSVGHPAISFGGDTLVFSSDMPGGFGETDLYMCIRKDGKWSKPINLGERVNTPKKDEFPFITSGGLLVFASNGRSGLGGLDLYYTKLKGGDIVHFESPINSEADDFAADFPEKEEYAYLSSNRPGKGNDDIYKFTFKKYVDYLLDLSVMDAKSKRPIPSVSVTFNDGIEKETGDDGKVNRLIEREKAYSLTAKAFGYTDETKNIKTGNLKQGTVVRDTVWMNIIVKKTIELKNIYYDFDKWDILPESEIELNKLVAFMSENTDVKIELNSHTDARGGNVYNQRLSEKRAKSAVDYIVSKGISPDRITAVGYGEERLVNQCRDGVFCLESEHRLNRRTEFIVNGLEE